jgi:3-oxoacyl-[acyl-carrier-protein] synthase-3
MAMADGPPLVDELLSTGHLRLADVDWFIPHQTSVRAIAAGERALAERLGCHPKHVVVTVDEYGNTASTTLFLALHRLLDERRLSPGDKVLLLSVASGLELGIVTFEVGDLQETHGNVH